MHLFAIKNNLAALALAFASLLAVSGCQSDPDLAARSAELAELPGLKVTIAGVALGHDRAQAIVKHLEGEAVDTGAAMVRLKKDDHGGDSLEIELYAGVLPAAGSLAAALKAAFPELADATITAVPVVGGGSPVPIIEVSDELPAEQARQEIIEQLQADGVEGNIDVQIEDNAGGRRIEVKVEKSIDE